jgi:hypothetical protein
MITTTMSTTTKKGRIDDRVTGGENVEICGDEDVVNSHSEALGWCNVVICRPESPEICEP